MELRVDININSIDGRLVSVTCTHEWMCSAGFLGITGRISYYFKPSLSLKTSKRIVHKRIICFSLALLASGCIFLSTFITEIKYSKFFFSPHLNAHACKSLVKLLFSVVSHWSFGWLVFVSHVIVCLTIFLSKNGVAAAKISKWGSSDRPRPSSTITANITEAKLDSSFTYNNKMLKNINILNKSHTTAQNSNV